MITHDAIRTLSYFARKINFAAKEGAALEEGESIEIIGAPDRRAENAVQRTAGDPNWLTELPAIESGGSGGSHENKMHLSARADDHHLCRM